MARFDVCRLRHSDTLVIDCQADVIDHFATCLAVPLVPAGINRTPTPRLHPSFVIAGETFIMATQLAAAVPKRELGDVVLSLIDHEYEIGAALDMLITGY